jgi:hypothetical protein
MPGFGGFLDREKVELLIKNVVGGSLTLTVRVFFFFLFSTLLKYFSDRAYVLFSIYSFHKYGVRTLSFVTSLISDTILFRFQGDLLKSASIEFMLTSQHPLQLPHVPEQVKHFHL